MKEKFSYPDQYYEDVKEEEENDAINDSKRDDDVTSRQKDSGLNHRIAFFGRHSFALYYDILNKSEVFEIVGPYVSCQEEKYRVEDKNMEGFADALKGWIGRFGLPVDATWEQWMEGLDGSESFFRRMMERCLVVEELEKKNPGITKKLYEDFGILNFHRYGIGLMQFQYEQIDNLDLPYGIIMYPKTDWNTCFSNQAELLTNLASELLEDGIGVRCVEAGNLPALYRLLTKLNSKYNSGQNNRMRFGVLGGHGSRSSILLGKTEKEGSKMTSEQLDQLRDYHADADDEESWDSAEVLRSDDRYWQYIDRIRKYFVDSASVVLFSCSTGKEGGIAQRIADKYGFMTSAPDHNTSFSKIDISYDKAGKVILTPTYHKGECNTFLPR